MAWEWADLNNVIAFLQQESQIALQDTNEWQKMLPSFVGITHPL